MLEEEFNQNQHNLEGQKGIVQSWCAAAFWWTLGPLSQATQDRAHWSVRTASPRLSCPSCPTMILIWQEISNQSPVSPQKPIGDQGWSLMGKPIAGPTEDPALQGF